MNGYHKSVLRQLAVIVGDALFIHGGLYDEALGAPDFVRRIIPWSMVQCFSRPNMYYGLEAGHLLQPFKDALNRYSIYKESIEAKGSSRCVSNAGFADAVSVLGMC